MDIKKMDKRSLTEAQDYKNQLRFYTIDRVERQLYSLLRSIRNFIGENLEIYIYNVNALDPGSARFLKILTNKNFGEVSYYGHQSHLPFFNDPIENTLQLELKKLNQNHMTNEVHDLALQFLSVGDAWTSIKLLKRILEINKNDEYLYDLGIAYTQIGETETAAYYLYKSKEFGKFNRVIDANYVLSMLYTRHHPRYLQSLQKAENLLQEAYSLFDDKEEDFHKIFNRNGYALILFKRGQIEKAISILKNGIKQLRTNTSLQNKVTLHESVLLYNLAQCYTKLNLFEEASLAFEELIRIDPYYPENRLEYAKLLLNHGDEEVAIKQLNVASELNPNLPEIYSIYGYLYTQRENFQLAESHYLKAFQLSNEKFEYLYDLIYTMTLNNKYQECYSLIKDTRIDVLSLNDQEYVDLFTIEAECLFNLGKKEEAIDIMRSCIERFPTNENLKVNIQMLEQGEVI
ncbi:tetratricopeptide repeat protein [Bacillus sp. IITD106]|nr:tetratricopeptide repeat protein [Bacillus sp. IITD106]